MATTQMLTLHIPIPSGDPLRLTDRSNSEISEEYFSTVGDLPCLKISGSGITKSADNSIIAVSLHFVVTGDFGSAMQRLRQALEFFQFPTGSTISRMWRGSDFTVQTERLYEHK